MIREINVKELTDNISEMCIQANHYLSPDMDVCMKEAVQTEKSELGKKILNQLQENLEIADKEMIPICQDTGMAVILWKSDRMYILWAAILRKRSMKEYVVVMWMDI